MMLVVDHQRALEEVLDVLGVAEEHVVEHRARQHRAGGQDVERHQHDLRALMRLS